MNDPQANVLSYSYPDSLLVIRKTEVWKDVLGYEGYYQVSNLGNVRSLNYNSTGRVQLLSPNVVRNGYMQVLLCVNSIRNKQYVHRLVATAFIPNPNNLPQVNHLNECKTDNRADNLQWVTPKDNCMYGTRNKRVLQTHKIRNTARAERRVVQYALSGKMIASYKSINEAARQTSIRSGSICNCCNNKYGHKSAGGYVWRFEV